MRDRIKDKIHIWIQEGRYGFVGALLREREKEEKKQIL